MMFRKMIRTGVCALALLGATPFAFAEPKIPMTAEEHFALAKQYQDKAVVQRKEAQEHREMAEAARRKATNDPRKGYGQRDPQVVKMEKHCEAIYLAAEKLAVANEKAADFHTFRGRELQGK